MPFPQDPGVFIPVLQQISSLTGFIPDLLSILDSQNCLWTYSRVGVPLPHHHACGPCSSSACSHPPKSPHESPAHPHAQVRAQSPPPTVPLLPDHVAHSPGCCVQNTKLPVPLVSPDLPGTYLSAAHILRFTVSHADTFSNPFLLPSTTCPCQRPAQIRHHTQSPDTVQVPVKWLSCWLQSTSPAQTRLLASKGSRKDTTVGIHQIFLVMWLILCCFVLQKTEIDR